MPYLVEKYGKDDALYPKDIKKRAIITQRLHFDSNVLFPRGGAITVSSYLILFIQIPGWILSWSNLFIYFTNEKKSLYLLT